MRHFRRDPRPDPGPPVNEKVLRFRDIRVIGSDGSQLGILQSRQALNMARDEGLDLVMVSPTAQPPVCKIIDYGKFKYLTEKQQKDKKSKQQEVKGIKISPRIAEHDLTFLNRNARKFLEEGHKVKVTCMFKAREVTHPELGRKKLDHFAELLADIASPERTPTLDGRMMIMVLLPKPNAQKSAAKPAEKKPSPLDALAELAVPAESSTEKKDAETENKQDSGEAV